MQVNVVYGIGSTGKIVQELHHGLCEAGLESVVYYGRGKNDTGETENIHKLAPEFIMKLQSLRGQITGYAYGGCRYSTYRLKKAIQKESPDIVHLQCINGSTVNVYSILEYLKKKDIKTVLTEHAEFTHTAGCGHAYDCKQWLTGCVKCAEIGKQKPNSFFFDRSSKEWNKMRKAFEGFNHIIICPVSEWLELRSVQSPFMKDKRFVTVYNGVNTEVFHYNENAAIEVKKKLHLEKNQIVLHVTPNFYSPIKGGKYVLEIAKKFKEYKEVKFLVVGYNGNGRDLPDNVIGIDFAKNQDELAAFYSAAQVTLLTSKRETFSMVTAESLCCGTPIAGFESGAPETIARDSSSVFVQYGNIELLVEALNRMLATKASKNELSIKQQRKFSVQQMIRNYCTVYGEI